MTQQFTSTQQLSGILLAIKGAKMLTVTIETEPKMRKTNNPHFGNVTKRTTMNVTMNFIYANSVNSQRTKEGNDEVFVPKARKWGEKIPGTCFVMHNGMMYMEVKANGAPQSVEYFLNDTGANIDKSEIAFYLQESNSNAEHQGVEKEIILRDIKIMNVKECKVNNIHYIVKNK